jgi:hypothetical protein
MTQGLRDFTTSASINDTTVHTLTDLAMSTAAAAL